MIVPGFVVGAGIGLGVMLILRGVLAGPPPLAQALADLHAPPMMPGSGRLDVARSRVLRRLADVLAALGLDLDATRRDLRVVDRTLERHLVEKLTAAAVGLALPPTLALLVAAGGVPVGVFPVGLASAVLATGGFLLPDMLLRNQADAERRSFRYALSSYLDLVQIVLAAGTGVETALLDAVAAADGPTFVHLRRALRRCRIAGETPWDAFRQVGQDLDIPELRELASTLSLAGTHGARVRSSLAARAEAMRTRDLADMEAHAEAATERMSVPTVLLVVGFIVFVGFPAAYEIIGF